jgi:dihydrofolate synthase / folylpolyglutamate synthase
VTSTPGNPSLEGMNWLFSLTNYEKGMPSKYSTVSFSTDRYKSLLRKLEDPQLCGLPTVQILGTDGKGSTLAFLEVLLEGAGKRVCSFISPHLVTVEERFRLNSYSVSTEVLNRHLEIVRYASEGAEGITFFEVLNAAFWLWVNEVQPDVVLLETGLGGRLDTTTVCVPSLKILTLLDRDHVPLLGKRVEQIALEKLAALRPGVPSLITRQSPHLVRFIEDYIEENGITAHWVERLCQANVLVRTRSYWEIMVDHPSAGGKHFCLGLLGDHQAPNFQAALCAAEILGVDIASLPMDMEVCPNWPGRCQLIQEPVGGDWILDGSHTPMSAQALRSVLDAVSPKGAGRTYLVAVSRDRFPWCYLRGLDLRTEDQVWLVDTGHPRLWGANDLRAALMEAGWEDFPNPPLQVGTADQWLAVPSSLGEIRIVCGSLYWVGHFLASR